MARRIDVELTSTKDDGRWTWRAANARQPKGELDGALLYEGAKVGDQFRVEAEFHLDGIEVIEVFPPRAKRERSDLLPLVNRPISDDELVTTVRSPRRERDDSRRGGRGDRGGRRPAGPRSERGEGNRPSRGDGGRDGRPPRDRGPRREREREQPRPKAKRLRPGRTHRNAALEAVPEAHRPIAEQIIKGGLPAVRAAIEKQNSEAAEGTPKVEVSAVLAIAEPLVPVLQAAEWRDRADAALADIEEIDLRDLRSVVVATDPTSKDDEVRALSERLRSALNQRLESDQATWLNDLTAAIESGRTIRALRLSSRPAKAGAPIPPELASKLAEAASAALSGDIASDRWAAIVDALAFSPVRGAVTPAGYPAEPTPELLEAVRRIGDRVPEIAKHFGIEPTASSRPRRRTRRDGAKPKAPAPAGKTPETTDSPAAEPTPEAQAAPAAEVVETPAPETTAPEAAPEPEAVETSVPAAGPAPEVDARADAVTAEETIDEPAEANVPTAGEAEVTAPEGDSEQDAE